jgi:hypothetical protein
MGATVDAEFQRAFATLSDQIANVGADARESVNVSKEALATAQRAERAANEAKDLVKGVERSAFGGPVPPAALNGSASLVRRAQESEADTDELKGQVLAMSGQIAKVSEELAKQSKAMGIGDGFFRFARSPAGRDLVIRVVTLVLAALGAGKVVLASAPGGEPSPRPEVQVHR